MGGIVLYGLSVCLYLHEGGLDTGKGPMRSVIVFFSTAEDGIHLNQTRQQDKKRTQQTRQSDPLAVTAAKTATGNADGVMRFGLNSNMQNQMEQKKKEKKE